MTECRKCKSHNVLPVDDDCVKCKDCGYFYFLHEYFSDEDLKVLEENRRLPKSDYKVDPNWLKFSDSSNPSNPFWKKEVEHSQLKEFKNDPLERWPFLKFCLIYGLFFLIIIAIKIFWF